MRLMLLCAAVLTAAFLCGCRLPVAQRWLSYRDIVYVQGSRLPSQKLDLFVPEGKGPFPLVVYIHGGGWRTGDKSDVPFADQLIKRGFALSSINYRLTGEAKFPAQIFDCKAAIRYLRANAAKYKLHPACITVWGISAGGHLSALLGTSNGRSDLEGDEGNAGVASDVQAVCDWAGPTDLLSIAAQSKTDMQKEFSGANGDVSRLMGGLPEQNKQLSVLASPALLVGRQALPPFLIMHGQLDPLVPLAQARELNKALKDVRADARLLEVANGAHIFAGAQVMQAFFQFLDKHAAEASKNHCDLSQPPSSQVAH